MFGLNLVWNLLFFFYFTKLKYFSFYLLVTDLVSLGFINPIGGCTVYGCILLHFILKIAFLSVGLSTVTWKLLVGPIQF